MKKEMVIKVGHNQVHWRDRVTQNVPDPKTDAGAESVQFQVSLRLLYGQGIAVPSLDLRTHPGGGQAQDARPAAQIQHPAGSEALAVLPHELDDIAEAKAGGGVFAGPESRPGPDLETGDSLKVLGKETGIAGDHKVVADPEVERGRFALEKFPDPTLEAGLEFAQGQDLGGVDLENGRMTGAFELGGRQFKLRAG
jgi:hypothetical protein